MRARRPADAAGTFGPAAWLVATVAALCGCATAPPAPTSQPASVVASTTLATDHVTQAIARHRQRATDYRRTGDYAAEAAQWQVLTLLAPDDPTFKRELATARAAIAATAQEQTQAGTAALNAGDLDRASAAFLRVLAVDPGNAEATRAMRDVERRRAARIQAAAASRAARSGSGAYSVGATDGGDGFDLDQAFELFRAGDTAAGLRDFRLFVDANPTDRQARQRIGAAVADRAKELEDRGSRDEALAMYENASSLRGDSGGPWVPRVAALRKALSAEAYDKALRIYRTDLAQAIQLLEASVKYDPANALASTRLREARLAQGNLSRIEQRSKGK